MRRGEKRRGCVGVFICRIRREELFVCMGKKVCREAATARQVGKLKLKCSIGFKVFVSAEDRGIREEASNSSNFTLLT